jgi:hypothetical protein
LQSDYDYVWAYDASNFSGDLGNIGERVYSYGALEVYRMRKQTNRNGVSMGTQESEK